MKYTVCFINTISLEKVAATSLRVHCGPHASLLNGSCGLAAFNYPCGLPSFNDPCGFLQQSSTGYLRYTVLKGYTVIKKRNILWFPPRAFNQDPLENYFGQIRIQGVKNVNPTSNIQQSLNHFSNLSQSEIWYRIIR